MADSSSWGCGNSGFEAERLSKTNRVKEAFNKDYDTLRKFIDMMQAAESLNVEDYNDVIIEKHNESVGYLKTAIFQAQSNVMDEVARQREVGSKTKFRYLKTSSGQKRQDGGAGNEAERGNQGESENESQSSETMSNASTDCAVSDEVGVPVRVEEEGQVLVLMDEQRSSAVARSNSHQAIAKHNKILTSLRKVASKSMMPDVVVVGRDTFFPGIITREELFNDNLKREIYYVNGHLHVSFLEENTHGWYPIRDVWILGKSCGEPWPVPNGQAGNKIRSSMEVARRVLKMQREERFRQVGAFAMQ